MSFRNVNNIFSDNYQAQQIYNIMKGGVNLTAKSADSALANKIDKDTLEKSGCTDGKDDGKITLGEKIKNFAKGVVSPITTMFKSPKNFFIGTGLILGTGLLVAATGGAAAPFLVGAGIIGGGIQIGLNAHKAKNAKTDQEAKNAWQGIGTGTTAVATSVIGAKGALKVSGTDTSKMGFLKATFECLKQSPKSLKNSVNAFKSGEFIANIKNIFSIKSSKKDPGDVSPKDSSKTGDSDVPFSTKDSSSKQKAKNAIEPDVQPTQPAEPKVKPTRIKLKTKPTQPAAPKVEPTTIKPADVKPTQPAAPKVEPTTIKPADVKPTQPAAPKVEPTSIKFKAKPTQPAAPKVEPTTIKPADVKPTQPAAPKVEPTSIKFKAKPTQPVAPKVEPTSVKPADIKPTQPAAPKVEPTSVKHAEAKPTQPAAPKVEPTSVKHAEVKPTQPAAPKVEPTSVKPADVKPSQPGSDTPDINSGLQKNLEEISKKAAADAKTAEAAPDTTKMAEEILRKNKQALETVANKENSGLPITDSPEEARKGTFILSREGIRKLFFGE